jgi:tetratricopeptide (TPR) repeat protein
MTFFDGASGAENATIERYGREAVELLEELNRAYPGNVEYQVLMADAYMAWAPSRRGSGTEEFDALKRANSLLEPLATRPDATIETRRLYAHLAEKLASIMSGESAKKHYQDSEQLLRDLLQEAPDDEQIRSLLAQIICFRLARFYPHSNEEVVALLEECVKLREGLVDDFPSMPKHHANLAGARSFLHSAYLAANAPEAALKQLLLAKELLDDLCREYPRHKDMFDLLGHKHRELYYHYEHFGSVADMLHAAEEWRDFLLLRAEDFRENDCLRQAGDVELLVGRRLANEGRAAEGVNWARQGLDRSLNYLESATKEERETALTYSTWEIALQLSRDFYETGDTTTAAEFSEYVLRAARLAPANAYAQLHSATALIELAQDTQTTPPWDDAAEKFAQAIDGLPDERLNLYYGRVEPRIVVCRKLAQWDQAFDRVLKLRPDEPCLWIGRAQHRATRGRWADAAADYEKVIRDRPISDDCIAYAAILLLLEDKSRYQQFCNDLVTRYGESPEEGAASVLARICALGPAEDAELSTLLRWATLGAKDELNVPNSDGWLSLGLTQYRAGNYDQAIKSLTRAHVPLHVGREQSWLLLAMAHHRLGNAQQAQKCMETAKRLIDIRSPAHPFTYEFGAVDWTELQLLSREAEALIGAPNKNNPSQVTHRNDEPTSSPEP